MLNVHLRVNDESTGRPTAVRLRVYDAAGAYRPPLGRLAEFATAGGRDVGGNLRLGGDRFCYVDGTCEVPLPPGGLFVEALKGPEYFPLRKELTLGPGKLALRLAVARWADLRASGWYPGDTRAHDLAPHAALLEGAAEDLAVVNLLARARPPGPEGPAAYPNLLAFSGTTPALPPAGGCQVVVNTLNAHPVLGSVALLNCHRVVHPLRFGGPDLADDWSVADWCDQCHRKEGLVVWADLPRLTGEHPQGEALSALLLGKVDAYEVCSFPEPEPDVLADYYRLLDCGVRVALVGGSGKDSNAVALGGVRTYARVGAGEEFGYGAWVEGMRAGRTFVTTGPLLWLSVDGEGPGAVLRRERGATVSLRAEARTVVPFDELDLLVNGTVVAAKETSGNRVFAQVETDWEVAGSAWVAARCWGRDALPGGRAYAHTSPVYLDVGGAPLRPGELSVQPLLAALDRTLAWVAGEARCDDGHRERLAGVLREGRGELLRRAGAG
jgi:hypothetical protein